MPTLRADAKPGATGAHTGRPTHYPSRFKIVCAPSIGKRGYYDVTLVKTSMAGTSFKQGSEVVMAWRGREDWKGLGSPYHAALAEAHALRDSLDASLRDLRAAPTKGA